VKTIRQLRESRGWSQEQLAKELGVSHSTVYNWEKGRTMPRVPHLQAIARTFNVSMDDVALSDHRSLDPTANLDTASPDQNYG
jgi:transcriptional regulator with XRE-family HTH domain